MKIFKFIMSRLQVLKINSFTAKIFTYMFLRTSNSFGKCIDQLKICYRTETMFIRANHGGLIEKEIQFFFLSGISIHLN